MTQFIDKKGRLFGKINVIDFLVLVFILCLMPVFYFGYKIIDKPLPPPPPPTITLNKKEYEERQQQHKQALEKLTQQYRQDIEKLTRELAEVGTQKKNLLKEHKRLKKYF